VDVAGLFGRIGACSKGNVGGGIDAGRTLVLMDAGVVNWIVVGGPWVWLVAVLVGDWDWVGDKGALGSGGAVGANGSGTDSTLDSSSLMWIMVGIGWRGGMCEVEWGDAVLESSSEDWDRVEVVVEPSAGARSIRPGMLDVVLWDVVLESSSLEYWDWVDAVVDSSACSRFRRSGMFDDVLCVSASGVSWVGWDEGVLLVSALM
jgi:hypothetical protein